MQYNVQSKKNGKYGKFISFGNDIYIDSEMDDGHGKKEHKNIKANFFKTYHRISHAIMYQIWIVWEQVQMV